MPRRKPIIAPEWMLPRGGDSIEIRGFRVSPEQAAVIESAKDPRLTDADNHRRIMLAGARALTEG